MHPSIASSGVHSGDCQESDRFVCPVVGNLAMRWVMGWGTLINTNLHCNQGSSARRLHLPSCKWFVQCFQSERLRVRPRRRSATFHTVGPCKKAVFACWATDSKRDTSTLCQLIQIYLALAKVGLIDHVLCPRVGF